ncbi:MAG: AI-2E family transporter [Chloroflexi bacterium]|nr:AI-2E family transporter [Chloroflexota bacterium]
MQQLESGAQTSAASAEPSSSSEQCIRIVLPAGEVARAGLVMLGLGLGVYVLWHIHEVIFLLFLGILLATAIEPAVNYLRRGPFGRGTGTLAVYTAIVLILGTILAVTLPGLASQSDAFFTSIPGKIGALRPYAAELRPEPLQEAALRAIDRLGTSVSNPSVPVDDQSLVQMVASVGHQLINFLTIFFLAFYWLVERPAIKRALLRVVPPSRARGVNVVWLEVEQKLGGWVRGELLIMGIMAVLAAGGFWVLGLPNPILLGILAGVAELVPVIGPILGFAPAVLVALGISPWTALLVMIYAIIIQQVESNLIVPRIMGHTVGVSPLTVVLGILIGFILYGLPGAFLAVPVAGAIQVIVAHAVGMEDVSTVSMAAHSAAVAREAAAEAAAGAAARAPVGDEHEAAAEAAAEALAGETPEPTVAAHRARHAVLAATAPDVEYADR